MMKRSLVLGALMAFVITGSAWAADYNHPEGECLDMSTYDSNITYENITVDNSGASVSNAMDKQAVVSKTANDALKATTSITIDSRNSGICSDADGSSIVVSAPTISINKIGNLSGIHLDREYSKVTVENFNAFSIEAKGIGAWGWSEGNGIRVNRMGAEVNVIGRPNSSITINAGSSGVVMTSEGKIKLSAGYIYITSAGANNNGSYKGQAIASNSNGEIDVLATDEIVITNTNEGNDSGNQGHTVWASNGSINVGTAKDSDGKDLNKKADVTINGVVKAEVDGAINLKLETAKSSLNGSIIDNNIAGDGKGTNLLLSNGAIWNNNDASNVTKLTLDDGAVKQNTEAGTIKVGTLAGKGGTFEVTNAMPNQMVIENKAEDTQLTISTSEQDIAMEDLVGVASYVDSKKGQATDFVEKTGGTVYSSEKYAVNDNGTLGESFKVIDSANESVNNMVAIGMMSWRAEMNDMNKRLGELRNANGEHGVWVRMVRGESEYNSVKNQYNQYQLGYDEKLSTDPSWTVGVALSYTDAENNFKEGNGESTNKALSIYGSKLNEDGTFVDLIAKYARLENDFKTYSGMGDADYDTNAYSFSAEVGKRIQQGNGLWIEPQVELTYGKVSAVDYVTKKDVKVAQDGMESLVGRVGFSLGKDISKGNVYARASYLYDFEGETKAVLGGDAVLENDLGGGWWEVGVGANINLSKATYIYADIEKTFGGEVDTNWQWNLGVRYSF